MLSEQGTWHSMLLVRTRDLVQAVQETMRGIFIGVRQVSQRACLSVFGVLGRQHAGELVSIAYHDGAPCRGQRKKAREQIDL